MVWLFVKEQISHLPDGAEVGEAPDILRHDSVGEIGEPNRCVVM
jgi:hypothetical protein